MTAERASPVAGFRLLVGEEDISDRARPRLVSLTLTEKRGGEADQLDLVLDDADGRLDIPPKGAAIALQLGWLRGAGVTVGLIDKGRFTVDQIEWSGPPDQLRITARSADLTAGYRTRREASHRDTTLGAVAGAVAQRHGLTARVAHELADVAVPVLEQHGQSDMAMLRALGRRHDAVATVKRGALILSPIGRGAAPSGRALPALSISPDQVTRSYRYAEIERSADAGVEARWHDQDSAERKTVREGGGGQGRGAPKRLGRVYNSEAEARAAARAAANRAKRAEASFELTLSLGRPDVYPEQAVTLAGFKPPVDARRWLIAEVTHELAPNTGLETRLKLETAG